MTKLQVIEVTPNLAKKYLEKNINNRKVNAAKVLHYSLEILNGNWLLNGDTIKVDINGDVLDGQHRLLAIIKANKGIESYVVTGLNPEVFKTIDQGKKRNPGDIFYIHGVQNAINISSGVSKFFVLSYPAGGRKGVTELLKEYDNHKELYNNLFLLGQNFYKKTHRVLTPSEYIGFFRFFMSKTNQDTVMKFFNKIESKEGIGGILYEKLLSNILSKRKMTSSERTAIIIKAFNAHSSGRVLKLLKYQADEAFPIIKAN